MTNREIFDKYRRRLSREEWLNAIICGFGIACAVMFVAAAVCWLVGFKAVWLPLAVAAAVWIAAACLLYFVRLKPDDKSVARRLDEAGLEERVVTMTEYADVDSPMVNMQRNDATSKLAAQNGVKVPFRFAGGGKKAKRVAAGVGTCAFVGIAMTLVLALTVMGVLPSGNEVIFPTEQPTVAVSYLEEEGGIVEGETDQIIVVGGTTTEVTAVPDEGYVFVEWSDGFAEPVRSDSNVQTDMTVFAKFEKTGDGEGDGGDPSDEPNDEPSEEQKEPSNGDPSGNQEKYTQNNTVLDGETDYKDIYAYYYELAKEYLASGKEIPEGLRAFLDSYIGLLN